MDRQPKTTVQINGRTYDARTGQIVRTEHTSSRTVAAPHSRGVILDGVRKNPLTAQNLAPTTSKPKPKTTPSRTVRTPGQALDVRAVKKPKKSQTLVRTAVKKPKIATEPTNTITEPHIQTHIVDKTRFERAKQFTLNRNISRFGAYAKPKPILAKMSVNKAPQPSSDNATPPSLVAAPPIPLTKATPVKQKHQKEEVFAHRIAAANTHLLKHTPKKSLRERVAKNMHVSPKIVSIGAACFAILLIGGFFAYQRVPNVAMRVAASQAGFKGTLPGQIPSGYAFKGPIQAEKNSITLTYLSNSDSRKILISQRPTEWTSESLLSNYIVDSKLRYQTYQDNGLTIYIYNEGSATWVDKGVWYNVSSQGALNSQQILSLASSM